ncbi:MAG: hypothetical protein GC208_09130 [Alphaproteobacteria bacterium]|nr:hypothetical protein [Alphaproteobacteria bacterium]
MIEIRQPVSALVVRGVVLLAAAGLVAKQAVSGDGSAWILLIAPAFYLSAMWALSGVFAQVDRGVAFGPAMVRALRLAGYALLAGAFAAVILQPSLIHLIANGFTEMRGVRLDWSVANLMLALLGFTLFLIARRGADLKARLEEFV